MLALGEILIENKVTVLARRVGSCLRAEGKTRVMSSFICYNWLNYNNWGRNVQWSKQKKALLPMMLYVSLIWWIFYICMFIMHLYAAITIFKPLQDGQWQIFWNIRVLFLILHLFFTSLHKMTKTIQDNSIYNSCIYIVSTPKLAVPRNTIYHSPPAGWLQDWQFVVSHIVIDAKC